MFERNLIRLLLVFIVVFAGSALAHADIVKGRVVDAETKEPLPEAQVAFVERTDYGMSVFQLRADSVGCFSFFAVRRGTIEVSMLGYYSCQPRLYHLVQYVVCIKTQMFLSVNTLCFHDIFYSDIAKTLREVSVDRKRRRKAAPEYHGFFAFFMPNMS